MAPSLSENQQTVLDHLKAGMTEKQIAKAMKTTDAVVKRQVTILRKNGWVDKAKEEAPPTFDEMIPPASANGHGDAFDLDKRISTMVESQANDLREMQEEVAKAITIHEERRGAISQQQDILKAEDEAHVASIESLKTRGESLSISLNSLVGPPASL